MARSSKRPLWLKLSLAVLILAPLAVGGWLWWDLRTWQPAESEYPEQGADLSGGAADVNFAVLKGQGADFVYLPATGGEAERYAATAMTLEMPFKDNADYPDDLQGWSPDRSKMLARDCLGALLEWLESED